ncbi:MAG: DUF2213 domain-containing protein [Candidatus Bathyarchaeota archaeon]|nr:DUF2213 domain-containing protein [Candidatus Bathyarchaeota archaeon]
MDGREYLVCPVVAVKQGILNTQLLLAAEIEKSVVLWNDVPIPIPHPLENGEKISARDLDVIEESVVGRFYNAYYENESLKGELWIDVEKAEKLGDVALTILKRLRKGDPVEVSTAYYSDTDLSDTGTYNGKQYVGVQHNLRPDHIALLLEGKGACSWIDGCGTPRINQELVNNPYPNEHSCRLVSPGKFQEEHWSRGSRTTDGKKYSVIRGRLKGETTTTEQAFRYPTGAWTEAEAKAHCKAHDGIKFEPATGVKTMELVVQLREGESYSDRYDAVEEAIREKVIPAGSSDWHVWISDLYENSVVYQVTEPDENRTYFQASYVAGVNSEIMIGEAIAVKRTVTYTTLQKESGMEKKERDGIVTAMKDGIKEGFNSLKSLITRGGEPMDKEQLIAVLLENDKELDKELLENADEKLLQHMVGLLPVENEGNESEGDKKPEGEPEGNKPKDETPKDDKPDELEAKIEAQIETHLQTKYKDFDQIKAHMDTMAAETDAAKKKSVDSLVANKQCTIDKEALEEMSPATLRQLDAAYAPGSYLGAGVPRVNVEDIPPAPSILLANVSGKKEGEK